VLHYDGGASRRLADVSEEYCIARGEPMILRHYANSSLDAHLLQRRP
jgi:hypothetical protein